MGYNYEYPYVDPHRYNGDWLLNKIKELSLSLEEFTIDNTFKVHEPSQWDITTQYQKFEIVTDNGKAYISKQPVPLGKLVTDTNYWTCVFDPFLDFDSIKEMITSSDEGNSTIATELHEKDTLFIVNNKLYQALSNIPIGNAFVFTGTGKNVNNVALGDIILNLYEELTETIYLLGSII